VAHEVVLVPGDGVGPEVTAAARRVLDATGVPLRWRVHEAGRAASERGGDALPAATLEAIRAAGACLKGPCETPPRSGLGNLNVALRRALGLFAGLRPCRLLPGVPSRYEAVDLIVVRESTEDLYLGVEFARGEAATAELVRFLEETAGLRVRGDSGISVRAISATASERIVRFAFGEARARGRRKVTVGHKANIMKFTDGLFVEVARAVAAEHPDVGFEDRIIDALTMGLVQRPEAFDVLVLPNLYGDIVSELCAGIVGGPGVVPWAHLGEGVGVFEPAHGPQPALAGTGRANPVAAILAGAMLLRHLGEERAAAAVEAAVEAVLAEGRALPEELAPGGPAVTADAFASAVVARLGEGSGG
jgi:isocitrate dehydrogenase (NAD+)